MRLMIGWVQPFVFDQSPQLVQVLKWSVTLTEKLIHLLAIRMLGGGNSCINGDLHVGSLTLALEIAGDLILGLCGVTMDVCSVFTTRSAVSVNNPEIITQDPLALIIGRHRSCRMSIAVGSTRVACQ